MKAEHTSAPIVELIDVKKRFGRVNALRGVNCKFYRGQITALVGDNGAGKSTLTKILCGVYPPTKGRFIFDGQDRHWTNPVEAREAGIETVYQDLALVESMSIARNFFLGKEIKKGLGILDHKKMAEVALKGVRDLGIELPDANRNVQFLSGGQRKSIAIARSLHFKPKLLILDEPTAALSIKESNIVLRHVEEVRERGIPVIFITHNIHLIYPIADRFILLEQGQKIGDVDKDEVTPDQLIESIVTGKEIRDAN